METKDISPPPMQTSVQSLAAEDWSAHRHVHMLFPVAAGGTAHVALKDLPVICGGGEARQASDPGDAFSSPQKGEAVLDPQEQDVLEDGHLHILLKKTAAFALADIHMVCNLIQRNLLGVMILDIGENLFQPCQMFLGLLFAGWQGTVIPVKVQPDAGQNQMHPKFIVRRRIL